MTKKADDDGPAGKLASLRNERRDTREEKTSDRTFLYAYCKVDIIYRLHKKMRNKEEGLLYISEA